MAKANVASHRARLNRMLTSEIPPAAAMAASMMVRMTFTS